MIDLQQFCSTEDRSPELMKPFSQGAHTYATNGHIGVRVPRVADVPDGGPDMERLFPKRLPKLSPARLSKLKAAPEETKKECDSCDGKGKEPHDCPDCDCECDDCDGTGKVDGVREIIDVALRGATFDLKYVHMIAALPGLRLPLTALTAHECDPMYFSFEGGDGLLMPRRRTGESIEAEMSQQSVDA